MTVTIVGVNHASPISSDTVEKTIKEKEPDKVLVELDEKRLSNLDPLRENQIFPLPITQLKPKEWLIYRSIIIRQKMAGMANRGLGIREVSYGPEYKAIVTSHKQQIPVIPMDKQMETSIDFSEFVSELDRDIAVKMNKPPNTLTEDDMEMIHNELAPAMPSIIGDRNEHIKKVINRESENSDVVVVTGIAHVHGIKQRLNDEAEVIT